MKYEDIYKRYLNSEIDLILEHLKESFIEYYGETNRNKIENIFNDLIIVYLAKNYSEQEINEKLSVTETSYKTYLNELLSNSSTLNENYLVDYSLNINCTTSSKLIDFKKKLLDLGYSKLLKKTKCNNSSLNIILEMSKGSLSQEIETLFSNYVDYSIAGFSVAKTNHSNLIGLRINKKGKISLHTLVHEINHQLQKEVLFYVANNNTDQKFMVEGITNNKYDLINELINEYCSKDVMDIFKKNFSSALLDLSFDSGYLRIDQLSGNVMKKTYDLLKKEISLRLINGNARTIRYIIDGKDKENYSLLNTFL